MKRFTYDYEDDKYYNKDFFKDNGKELYKDELLEVLNTLHEENEQLQARNDIQAKRLGELYEFMAKKDWESLTAIIDDFKKAEEQLQREWKTYE